MDNKKIYIYESVTETIEIEVSAEWMAALEEEDRKEYNNDHTETRRHEHYSCGDESAWLADSTFDPLEMMEKIINLHEQAENAEKIRIAFSKLNDKQKLLIKKMFILHMTEEEIAKEEHVSQPAISYRLEVIRKKIKKFL